MDQFKAFDELVIVPDPKDEKLSLVRKVLPGEKSHGHVLSKYEIDLLQSRIMRRINNESKT